jgi:hypothetical protein
MRHDPFATRNRVHRELIDTPWTERTPPHRMREEWRSRTRARKISVKDFSLRARILRRLRRHWIEAGALLILSYFLSRVAWALAAGWFE